MIRQKDTVLHIILLVSDFTGAALSIVLAYLIRYHLFIGISENFDSIAIAIYLLVITLFVNAFYSPVENYVSRGPYSELLNVSLRQLICVAIHVLILYFAHIAGTFSRLVFGYYLVISILIIWAFRLLIKKYLRENYKNTSAATRVVLVAEKSRIPRITKRIESSDEWKTTITKTIAIDISGYEKALKYIVHHEADEVFISIADITDEQEYLEFIRKLIMMGIKVDIDINQFELDLPGKKSLDEIGKCAVASFASRRPRLSQRFLKRTVDIIGGIIGTLIFMLAYLILGPMIKLDSKGPVIFVQKRVGLNGRAFDFYKFRSMYADAEARKKELMDRNESKGLMFKMEDDPRITKIGKFLRKSSLDELPQFINVLRGDMSLVGTRPPTMDEFEQYETWHKARLSMKPGITGLWQVSGRSDIKDFDEVVKLDMQYIDNWFIWNDIKIILKTIWVVIAGKGSR